MKIIGQRAAKIRTDVNRASYRLYTFGLNPLLYELSGQKIVDQAEIMTAAIWVCAYSAAKLRGGL